MRPLGAMTRGERAELGALIRKREKVLKSQAGERSQRLMAEFETQAAQIYSFNDDEVWEEATEIAAEAVKKAQDLIKQRCNKLGIPAEFQPTIAFGWSGRGSGAVACRQAELRRKVRKQVEALEAQARAEIERMSLDAQTEVTGNGLTSDAAKAFLSAMPPIEKLMPGIDLKAIKKLIEQRPEGQQYMQQIEGY